MPRWRQLRRRCAACLSCWPRGGGLAFMPTISLAMSGAALATLAWSPAGQCLLPDGRGARRGRRGQPRGDPHHHLARPCQPTLQALTGGYALGFVIAGGCVASAVAVAAAVLCARPQARPLPGWRRGRPMPRTRRDAPRAALPSQQRVDLAHLPGVTALCLARRSFLPPVRRS